MEVIERLAEHYEAEEMQDIKPADRRHEPVRQAQVIDTVGGYFESQEVPFGVVYKWHPGYVLLKCGCGEELALTCSVATCGECGADHAAVVQEALAGQCSEEEALHPWRYAGEREGLGLPF